jgi:hypothetical protein
MREDIEQQERTQAVLFATIIGLNPMQNSVALKYLITGMPLCHQPSVIVLWCEMSFWNIAVDSYTSDIFDNHILGCITQHIVVHRFNGSPCPSCQTTIAASDSPPDKISQDSFYQG